MSIWATRYGRQAPLLDAGSRVQAFLGLLLAASAAMATDAAEPDQVWAADTVQPLTSKATGLAGRPLRVAPDGPDGLWIAGHGELARWSPAGVSEQHRAAQTAWMVDDHVQHLVAHGDALWFGTPAGLGRLGVGAPAWFGPDSGLPDPRITALSGPTPEGDILVGTWRGASRLSPIGHWRAIGDSSVSTSTRQPISLISLHNGTASYAIPGQVPPCGAGESHDGPRFITALRTDANGHRWAGDNEALWVCRDGRWGSIARMAGGVLSLATGGQQRMWVGSGSGLWMLRDDDLQIAAGPDAPIVAMLAQANGVVAGTQGDGLWDCQSDQCDRVDGLPAGASVRALAQAEGVLWVTTESTLYSCSGRCEPFVHADLPPAGELGPVAAGTGVTWFGAPGGGGIVRIDSSGQVRRFSVDRRLPQADILALLPAADGLWLATETGLVKYADAGFSPVIMPSASLAAHNQGRLLVGGPSAVTVMPSDIRPAAQTPIMLPSAGLVRCLSVDTNGHIWAGGPQGLAEFDREMRALDHTDKLPNPSVRDLAVDADGRLWVATSGGLATWQDDNWRVFTKADGLPSDVVWAVHADLRGGVWVGTFGAGAARFDGERFRPLTSANGLPSNVVRQILSDGSGNVWFVTDTGLAMIAHAALPDLRSTSVPIWLWPSAGALLALGLIGLARRRR